MRREAQGAGLYRTAEITNRAQDRFSPLISALAKNTCKDKSELSGRGQGAGAGAGGGGGEGLPVCGLWRRRRLERKKISGGKKQKWSPSVTTSGFRAFKK